MSLFLQQSLRSGEFQILCYFVWPDPMDVGGWSGQGGSEKEVLLEGSLGARAGISRPE